MSENHCETKGTVHILYMFLPYLPSAAELPTAPTTPQWWTSTGKSAPSKALYPDRRALEEARQLWRHREFKIVWLTLKRPLKSCYHPGDSKLDQSVPLFKCSAESEFV